MGREGTERECVGAPITVKPLLSVCRECVNPLSLKIDFYRTQRPYRIRCALGFSLSNRAFQTFRNSASK